MKTDSSVEVSGLSRTRPLLAALALWCALTFPVAPAAGEARGCPSDLETMATWMCGAFSSQEQAELDPSYFDIRLHMVRIWKARGDGIWLYVEQARHDYIDRPYRQRIYQLIEGGDGSLESRVYTFQDPMGFAGAWRNPGRFDTLAPENLQAREGCNLFLRRQDEQTFDGKTIDTGCESSINGAAYAISEATVTAEGLVTWDRGFSADGRQVWGATAGGYRFKRIQERPTAD